MPLIVNNTTIKQFIVNKNGVTTDLNLYEVNGTYVFVKPFTYTAGSKTGVASITCYRASSPYANASIGTVSNGGTIYYGDTIYFTASASTGYNVSSSATSSSPITVTGNITGANYITATRKTFDIFFGGTNVYFNNTSQTRYNTTAYYGDILEVVGSTFYVKKWDSPNTIRETITVQAIPQTGYSGVGVFPDPDSPITSTTTVTCQASYSRLSYNISFATTTYGSWSGGTSKTAYYGDKITRSGNTVTCYKWDDLTTARWTNTLNANTNTTQYSYTATASGNDINSVESAASFGATSSRTTNKYPVTFSLGNYVTSAFTSTNQNATSGNASGTTYAYGTRVYYFVVKNDNTEAYTYTCSGTQVSGNVYRLGYVDVDGTENLGTLSSVTRTSNLVTYEFTIAFINSDLVEPYYICSSYEDYQGMIAPGGLGNHVVMWDNIGKTVSPSASTVTITNTEINNICMPMGYWYDYGNITFNVDPSTNTYYVGVYVIPD